jgi:hypothetical protein
MNYRFKRRSFLAPLGGAVAFQTMLENLEAAEAGRGVLPGRRRPHRGHVAAAHLRAS